MIQLFEGDEGVTHIMHRVSVDTLFQLADMFRLTAERVKEAQLEAEAKEIAEQAAYEEMHPPLPFESVAAGIGKCSVCGVTTDIYPDAPAPAYCYEHCEDHDYQVDSGERRCIHCNKPVPDDWYDE